MDARTVSPELFATIFPEGSPPTLAKHLTMTHMEHIPNGSSVIHRIVQLILYLTEE
jgi:hypothetical protein